MKAFTLIEIIIVIGIVGVIMISGFIFLGNYRQRQGLENTAQSIAAFLREARQRAINQIEEKEWGVHFEKAAGGRDFYALFSGSVYNNDSINAINYLPAFLKFSDPSSGSKDIIFEKLTGLPAAETGVTVALISNPSVYKIISVSGVGQIRY